MANSGRNRFCNVFLLVVAWFCGLALDLCRPAMAQMELPVEQLIRQLKHPIESKRVDAVRKLSQLGRNASQATEPLIVCLEDPSSDVRVEAAYAVSCVQTGSQPALAALVALLADHDEHVRYSAEWSIARISKELTAERSQEGLSGWIGILQNAIKALRTVEHQARNRIAIESALERLSQSIPPETPPVGNTQEASQALDAIAIIQSVYEANDRLGRFVFVNRLADEKQFPDALRQIVLQVESKDPECVVLSFAVSRWAEAGQRNLTELIEAMPLDEILSEADAQLIQYQIPSSTRSLERLIHWATDRNQVIAVRNAAIQAMAHSSSNSQLCVSKLIGIVSDEASDEETRAAAADAIGTLGIVASQAEACLLAAIQPSQPDSLRFSALDAIVAISPKSTTVAKAIVSLLQRSSVEDNLYLNLIETSGIFGEYAAEAVPVLAELLKSEDSDVRGVSVKSLGLIGLDSHSVIASLIERIVDTDEVISVKNRASIAISQIGPNAIEQLIGALQSVDEDRQESILRAIAIVGPNADAARATCLAILNDAQKTPQFRSTAAYALGSIGPGDLSTVQQVIDLCESDEVELVRSACLIAAARMNSTLAKTPVLHSSQDPTLLVRASAAYALHLCGESRMGFDLLVGMLNGSEADDVIQKTLGDLGPMDVSWLIEVAKDTTASREARLACFMMACNVESPAWSELLPLVEDYELGEEFTFCLEGFWHTSIADDLQKEAGAITTLLETLENHHFTPVARARIAGLLSPDGLGAGEDDEEWQGITLSKPQATGSLLANDEPETAERSFAMPAAEAAPTPLPTPSSSPSAPPPPPPASAALKRESPVAAAPIQPKEPVRARGADTSRSMPAFPKEIDIFYGTNRSPLHVHLSLQNATLPILLTIAGSIAVMIFCLVGLWRSGNRGLASIAFFAIGFIAPIGLFAVQKVSEQYASTSASYGVDYRDSVEYGMCKVSLPPIHMPGMLEAPSLLRLEVKSDPNKHVMLTKVEQLSQDNFFLELHTMQAKKGKNLLVFIHGYNVSFEDAARRTAQMAADLEFPGAPVFYSWPSQSNWYAYKTDQENIQLSVTQIRDFLLDLVAKSGAETINLVAHSMGNVGLTEALKEIQAVDDKPLFNQVVLAAPDIDANIFKSRIAPHIVTKAEHMTLYTSQSDLALVASRFFNHGQRIGDSGPGALLFPGIDTIDATAVDSSLLGHNYYGDSVSVLTDLGQLLRNQPITNRHYLQEFNEGTSPYWAFDPLRVSTMPNGSVR